MATDFGGKGSRRTFAARLLREVQAQSALSGTLVPQIAALPAGTLVSTDRLPAVSAGGAGKTLTPANFRTFILPDGDKGDITTSASGATWTIDAGAVSYAKIQNVAANTFLANATGSPATVQEIATNRIPLFASAITGTPSGTTYLRGDGTWATVTGGSGDVVGPASSTDHAIARFDLTTGKLLQNSNAILTDAGTLTLDAGSTTNALVVTTTGSIKQSIRHDSGNRWDTTVSSGGFVSFNAVGSDARFGFEDRVSVSVIDDDDPALQVSATGTNAAISTTALNMTAQASHTSGTMASLIGIIAQASIQGTGGTVTAATGLRASVSRGNGTLVDGIGVDVQALSSTMTNAYGIRVGNVTGGSSLNYAIYTGTGLVRFGDTVQGTKVNIEGVAASSIANSLLSVSGIIPGSGGTAYGAAFEVRTTATGQTTNAFTSKVIADVGGTYNAIVGVGIEANVVGGGGITITENYGLRVASQTAGVTNYAIYTGTGLVRFGDAVTSTSTITGTSLIGTTRVTAPLIGTTTATDVVFDRNSVTQLTLGSLLATFAGSVNAVTEYRVAGTKVVGAQGATISDPTGGTVQDSEARTAINTIIDRLQAHGLIA